MSANDLPDAALAERWMVYEERKRAWVEEHPEATPREYDDAMRVICDELGC